MGPHGTPAAIARAPGAPAADAESKVAESKVVESKVVESKAGRTQISALGNRLFCYIENCFDPKEIISIIFCMFWQVQIHFFNPRYPKKHHIQKQKWISKAVLGKMLIPKININFKNKNINDNTITNVS